MSSGVIIKTPEEIEFIRQSSLLVGKTHAEVAKFIKPGVTTQKLNEIAESFIQDNGATATFKGYEGYPFGLCISVNSAIVHGFPSKYELKETDIVSIDCGVTKNGFIGDSAYTYALAGVEGEFLRLLRITLECLKIGITFAAPGKRIGDIAYSIQNHAEKNGYSIVRELVGHGVGKNLHEKPEVPNYGKPGNGMKLEVGMTLAIEPMVNMGRKNIKMLNDGWTIVTADGKPSAHFEHTIAVTENGADILSSFEEIEKSIKENKDLKSING
mgnify:CR=1 FL=1